MSGEAAGRVIDSHHHLWDLGMGRHPWLAEGGGLPGFGDLSYLRHDYLPAQLEADLVGTGVSATVCVEALWDRGRDPLEEVAWWDGLARREGIAARYVARADLAEAGAAARVARLAGHARVVGVRESVRWHPDPARRWSAREVMKEAAWQAGVGLLAGTGLLLELLVYPWQAADVAALARAHPGLVIVVNHCGSPIDRDAAGVARWREGLVAMGAAANVHLKLSNFARYAAEKTPDGAWAVLAPCLEAFGAGRCLWGSDFPVARSTLPYGETLGLFRAAIAGLPEDERAAVLWGTAARIYRMS